MSDHFEHVDPEVPPRGTQHLEADEAGYGRAEAIARGEASFETTQSVVPGPVVNRMLVGGVVIMSVIAIVAILCLTAFSIYRGQERHSFNRTVAALQHDLDVAQQQRAAVQHQLDALNAGIECRAVSQLDLDQAQALAQVAVAKAFSNAINKLPPDASAFDEAAARLQAALDARAAALKRCAAG